MSNILFESKPSWKSIISCRVLTLYGLLMLCIPTLWPLLFFLVIARRFSHYFIVTETHVKIRTGLFSSKWQSIPLYAIKDTSSDSSFTDRLLNTGDIILVDSSDKSHRLVGINNYESVRESIANAILVGKQTANVRILTH